MHQMNQHKHSKLALAAVMSLATMSGCAYNAKMGASDEFEVNSVANAFAPSVTCVSNASANHLSCYAGPSIIGQTLDAAGTVAGGYLLGQGIGKAGSNTSLTTSTSNSSIAGAAALSNAQTFSVTTQPGVPATR